MLKYLVIQLDDTSVSFCHYPNNKQERKLIAIDILKAGILFAMKENLYVQFVYPDYELPTEYNELIESIDHCKIIPSCCIGKADVVVFDTWKDLVGYQFDNQSVYVLRISKNELHEQINLISSIIDKVKRFNIIFTDLESLSSTEQINYQETLSLLSDQVKELYEDGMQVQLNLLTDRMMLTEMNNCNAGYENITLAPNGYFYACPAFYLDNTNYGLGDVDSTLGNVTTGIHISNAQLYKREFAPICNKCDAFHCKRCIWLNRKMTYELNTPSREQCITAHLERNESENLLKKLREHDKSLFQEVTFNEIDYLDPFDKK